MSQKKVFDLIRDSAITVLSVVLCLYTLIQVNFSEIPPRQMQSMLAVFTMLGMVLCFLSYPVHPRLKNVRFFRYVDVALALLTILCCGYVVVQNEEMFKSLWIGGQSLGSRAGVETTTDYVVGLVGLLLVLEATRRAIGWIVPALALVFVFHSYYCYLSNSQGWPPMPDWMLPHAGQNLKDISSTTFLQSLGVFGVATGVMFKYVFLFVVFGSFLEISGATQFIIDFAQRIFGRSPGGPAKVSVLGSGLMGSLSGSAVANAVTTGSFTIPMMRSAGFEKYAAGGITAAAASGGALVPPVMGAGAYMMLELVDPQVTFLQIARAAAVPAILYYFSLWMIVHFYSQRMGATAVVDKAVPTNSSAGKSIDAYDGLVFFAALAALIGLLALKFTPFRAVSGSLVVILLMTAGRKHIGNGIELTPGARIMAIVSFLLGFTVRLIRQAMFTETFDEIQNVRQWFEVFLDASIWGMIAIILFGLVHPIWRQPILGALVKSAKNGISLVAASACVGIIIGIVQQTGIAADFSGVIKGLVEDRLLLALIGIMGCSIVLGMGVPSVVCYLLMATLMGTLLSELGVIPLGAHLFIFYFGMMSMVTPPVALAAYASASIAEASIMRTAFAAFRFALVGFTLPYMFVYRPALLLMNEQKWDLWIDANKVGDADAPALLEAASAAWPAAPDLAIALAASILGIIALAAGIAGYLRRPMSVVIRVLSLVAAAMLLIPEITIGQTEVGIWVNVAGTILLTGVIVVQWRGSGNVAARK